MISSLVTDANRNAIFPSFSEVIGAWLANQRAPSTLSPVLVYTNMRYSTLLMWCLICGITFSVFLIDWTSPVVCYFLLRLLEGTLGAKVFALQVVYLSLSPLSGTVNRLQGKKSWRREILGSRSASYPHDKICTWPFFLADFFRVTLVTYRLSKRGTTRNLDEMITLELWCRTNCMSS